MNSLRLGHNTRMFVKSEGEAKLKEILHDMCDENYNGDSGKESHITDEHGNSISRFEEAWKDTVSMDTVKRIKNILNDNYDDACYNEYEVSVSDVDNYIFISLAYTC